MPIKFIRTRSEENEFGADIEFVIPDHLDLTELTELYQDFLRACGYILDNDHLEFVSNDTETFEQFDDDDDECVDVMTYEEYVNLGL